ncbi:hypothetical protein PMIN01_12508 [Paraphaeosphaeria minitans]|uniref:Uncharacterized protein n=1 Tax=Paraphaeosphaeria minitans TaxID=565426 RepID=A0A9P6G697_9PLEO|nr:hypothetical protein PMIN01_12508 [Paraphaeosphaeria minitans]
MASTEIPAKCNPIYLSEADKKSAIPDGDAGPRSTASPPFSVYWLDGTLAGRVGTNGSFEPNEMNIRDVW